jgi:hypothetical protein
MSLERSGHLRKHTETCCVAAVAAIMGEGLAQGSLFSRGAIDFRFGRRLTYG